MRFSLCMRLVLTRGGDSSLLSEFLRAPNSDTLRDVLWVRPLRVSLCSPKKEVLCRTITSMPTVM